MIIQSLQQAINLPPGRFYLETAFCNLEGKVTEANLRAALAILGQFPVEATCQAEIIGRAFSLPWELPKEETP
jgi:hypothetical protein